jgi:BirA family transcriptional regulator, biotin operon repressor / biotin---[acetyl-CoA-carboxylase] ligase
MKGVHHLEVTGSTNDVAHDLAARGALDGTVVIAETQEAGRGRRGRDWFSPAKGNVYLSYVHRSRLQPAELSALTLDAATAVATALEDATGVHAELKWPNDLLVGGRKIAGILTELHTELCPNGSPVVIIGVGVNVAIAASEFPEELRTIATSVLVEAGEAPAPRELAELIARRLREKLAGYEAARGPDMAAYMARFPFVGTRFRHDDTREGTITGVGADGGLAVQWDDTETSESIWSGEIVLLGAGSVAS